MPPNWVSDAAPDAARLELGLTPRQLDAFRKVMLTGSMTIAAERLQISQPAVSKLIKDLEASVGVKLFRREGNRLIPGAEAQRLFREVDLFYRGIEQVERVARDLRSARIGSLRIASLSALALNVLCECIGQFSATHTDVEISLDVRNSLSVLELAAANQIDVGFIHQTGAEYPGAAIFPLQSVPAVCVMPSDHRLVSKQVLEMTDFEDEPVVSLGLNNPLRLRLESALHAAQVRYRRPIETTLAYSACNFVRSNMGIAVVDPFTAANFASSNTGIVARPVRPVVPFECSFVIPANQLRSKVVDEFLQVVEAHFARPAPTRSTAGPRGEARTKPFARKT